MTPEFARSAAFWAAADAWASSALRVGRLPNDPAGRAAAEAARARRFAAWAANNGRALPHTFATAATGGAVRVGPELSSVVASLIASAAPALARAMDAHLGRLAFDAWRAWPVKTGWSKSLLLLEYSAPGDGVLVGSITSYARYTAKIRGGPFRALLDSRGPEVAKAIGTEAVDDLAEGGTRV